MGGSSWFWITNFNNFWNIIWSMDWNFISVISISIGALILYSIGNFFFRDLVKNILEKKFEKYIHFISKKMNFIIFLSIDLLEV